MELLDGHNFQSKMSPLQCFVDSCVGPSTAYQPVQYVCYPCHHEPKVMQVSTDQAMTVVDKHT